LIRDGDLNGNIDSKTFYAGFDYFKFLFHRRRLATFATQSILKPLKVSGLVVPIKPRHYTWLATFFLPKSSQR
jgi:hypothetical protein